MSLPNGIVRLSFEDRDALHDGESILSSVEVEKVAIVYRRLEEI